MTQRHQVLQSNELTIRLYVNGEHVVMHPSSEIVNTVFFGVIN